MQQRPHEEEMHQIKEVGGEGNGSAEINLSDAQPSQGGQIKLLPASGQRLGTGKEGHNTDGRVGTRQRRRPGQITVAQVQDPLETPDIDLRWQETVLCAIQMLQLLRFWNTV